MITLVDTSVLIDYLRGVQSAFDALEEARSQGPLHASQITRSEILAGMRPKEEPGTRLLFSAVTWHDVDEEIAEVAGALGRKWLAKRPGIDSADLVIAATAISIDATLLTLNVKHFPMFPALRRPY